MDQRQTNKMSDSKVPGKIKEVLEVDGAVDPEEEVTATAEDADEDTTEQTIQRRQLVQKMMKKQ